MKKLAILLAFGLPCILLASCGDIDLRNILVQTVENAKNNETSPAAPSGLGVTMLSVSMLHLTWTDNSSNETGFKIERSPNGTTNWTLVKDAAANTTSWDDSGLSAGTAYYYRIMATNAVGDSAYSNSCSVANTNILIAVAAAGDSFNMGDDTFGPNPPTGRSETISTNYNMSKYEITNAEFAQFIADGGYSTQSYWTTNGWTQKTSGAWIQPGYWIDSNFNSANQPVVGVSWYEAVAFCNWRSVKEGLTPAYNSSGQASLSANGYRLPTEVEWEYAAAKGASGQGERIYAYASTWDWNKVVCNTTKTADVGSKSTAGDTPQGLADMCGNVWEWCSDNYQDDISITATTDRYYLDPSGPPYDTTSLNFMFRGGSWYDTYGYNFSCAFRYFYGFPISRGSVIGFRVVRR
jgi:formylglycine-generating enzyme required for sulfatase activity